ncbi:MAG: TolC family protein [Bacteroidales bacterium]|nr:TolC family protein [Bacteroidales bacterium]
MKNIILWAIPVIALLNSCGVYTKYIPVDEVSENLYGDTNLLSDSIDNIALKSWRDIFQDPYLQKLIEKGLADNIDLQTASLRVEEAQASLMSAKLAFLPSFALAPQGLTGSFDWAKATQTYSLPVNASWEIDLFGRLRNAKNQNKALLEQTKDYHQAIKTQVVSAIANAYFTLVMLDTQLAISLDSENTWKQIVSTSESLMDAGMSNQAAVSQMKATYFSIASSIMDLKEQINIVENSLSVLIGNTPSDIERNDAYFNNFSEPISIGIPLQLLSNRPDVRMAQRSMEAAFYVTNQAKSAFYPSVVLSGSAGWTNSVGSMIVNPGKFLASAVASLTQPLFNNGTNIARLKISKAQQQETVLNFKQTLLLAGGEVNDALFKYQTASEKAEYCNLQVESLEKAFESTSLLMKHGNTTYLEVLTAQQTLLNARLNKTANDFNKIQGVINLYHALGGGEL